MADSNGSMKDKISRSNPIRAFGRALNWMGNGAKSVVRTPFRASGRRRAQLAVHGGAAAAPAIEAPVAAPNSAELLRTLGADCLERMQQAQQQVNGRLQEGADFLRRRLSLAQPTSSFLATNCFPPRLVTGQAAPSLGSGEQAQDLVCTGSREMLRIRIYDYAVYLDRRQVQQSRLSRRWSTAKEAPPEEMAVTHGLRDAGDIDMCLVVRASRNLPIRLLAKEYERILRRRLRVVGGNPNDPALAAMIANLREERLPGHIKDRGSVRRGSVIAFMRSRQGQLTAIAGGVGLGSVSSEKLAQAVFDIYLGRQPVSVEGRKTAGESVIRMLEEPEFEAPRSPLLCNASVCRVGRL